MRFRYKLTLAGETPKRLATSLSSMVPTKACQGRKAGCSRRGFGSAINLVRLSTAADFGSLGSLVPMIEIHNVRREAAFTVGARYTLDSVNSGMSFDLLTPLPVSTKFAVLVSIGFAVSRVPNRIS